MYRIAVCEDEPLAAEQNINMTCRILDSWNLVRGRDYEIDSYCAANPLLERMNDQADAYHLLLLDIQMGAENGVELAALLRKQRVRTSILYITGYQDYARDALHTRALDFLTKPVDENKLAAALDWDFRENYRLERPVLHTGSGAIPLEEILYLEATQHKVAVYMLDRELLLPESLSKLEPELLSHGFCHSHFSFLVNLAHVREIGRTTLVLNGGRELPVSRRSRSALIAEHIQYMKQMRRK